MFQVSVAGTCRKQVQWNIGQIKLHNLQMLSNGLVAFVSWRWGWVGKSSELWLREVLYCTLRLIRHFTKNQIHHQVAYDVIIWNINRNLHHILHSGITHLLNKTSTYHFPVLDANPCLTSSEFIHTSRPLLTSIAYSTPLTELDLVPAQKKANWIFGSSVGHISISVPLLKGRLRMLKLTHIMMAS